METRKITELPVVPAASESDYLFGMVNGAASRIPAKTIMGGDAADGRDGGYYTPTVTQPDAETLRIRYTPSQADMPGVDSQDVALPKGPQGEKGDAGAAGAKGDKGDPGEQGPQGEKGDKGDTGPQGEPGADGAKGDKGDTGATGPQGPQGEQGPSGRDGYTPVKGTDYWTAADKAEMVSEVIAALPDASEVSY